MRYRAHEIVLTSVLVWLAAAGTASSQSSNVRSNEPPGVTARTLVLPASLRIEAQSSRGDVLHVVRNEDGSWSGILGAGGSVWTARDEDCQAFRDALIAFADTPALLPGPRDLRSDTASPPGAYAPHAFDWTLEMTAYAPDQTSVQMRLSGSQGPYARWADDAAQAVRSCGREEP